LIVSDLELSLNFGDIRELWFKLPTWIFIGEIFVWKICLGKITIASHTRISRKCFVFFVDVPPGNQYGGILAAFTKDASNLALSSDIRKLARTQLWQY
jgi:hypothetical protein